MIEPSGVGFRAGGTEDSRGMHSQVFQQWHAGAGKPEDPQGAADHF